MKHRMKTILKAAFFALGFALMLTPLCYGQATYEGPPHNVIYWNGDTSNNQLQTLASSAYTDVIVNFVVPDGNCNVSGFTGDIQTIIQTLHQAGKTVLVSFGGSDATSAGYQACYSDMLQGGTDLLAKNSTSDN
jgi:hypothetical protein